MRPFPSRRDNNDGTAMCKSLVTSGAEHLRRPARPRTFPTMAGRMTSACPSSHKSRRRFRGPNGGSGLSPAQTSCSADSQKRTLVPPGYFADEIQFQNIDGAEFRTNVLCSYQRYSRAKWFALSLSSLIRPETQHENFRRPATEAIRASWSCH